MPIENGSIREDNMLEAYAFYKVFYEIHKKYFNCKVSIDEMMDFAAYSIVYAVNGALACEVALKAVLDFQTCKQIKHCLDQLYNSIDNKYKQKIKERFMMTGLSEKEFIDTLQQSSNVFVEWRYCYEEDSVSIPAHFYNLVEAICQTMFSLSELIEVSN